MKHLYIFNERSRGAVYGIGSYIQQLTDCLSGREDISVHLVQLNSDKKEITIEEETGYDVYYFPSLAERLYITSAQRYYRNILYLLSPYIKVSDNDSLAFHFNYHQHHVLVELLKGAYPFCKTLYTIHYQNWCFTLKGNTSYFKRIIHSEKESLEDKMEKSLYESFEKERTFFNEVDQVICLCDYTRTLLHDEYGVSKDKITLIENGLKDENPMLSSDAIGLLKQEYHFSKDEKIILFVGRLTGIKGVDVLIQAFRQVVDEFPNIHLIIAGDGNYSQYLKECKGYWNKITFTGRIEKEELYKFYQIADVGVMLSTHEQCSYVGMEMMMFGIPLIATTTTGLREMLIDGKNGWQIEIEEKEKSVEIPVDKVKEKLQLLLSSDNLEMRTAARNMFLERYELSVMCEKYLAEI